MNKKVTIVIPHGHTWKWTQVVVSSFKKTKNNVDYDIMIVNNSSWHNSIRGITETKLGEGVKVVDNWKPNRFHASALDCAIELIDTEYIFTAETDIMACKDGWLDWYLSFLEGEQKNVAVGYYWDEGGYVHNYINPSATLYRTKPVQEFNKLCMDNHDYTMYFGEGFNQTMDIREMDQSYLSWTGAFAEKRGFKQKTGSDNGRLNAGWYEPGQQLYYWLEEQGYNLIKAPVDHRYFPFPDHVPEGTYYGGYADPYYIHFWGGTRAWDRVKHDVNDGFVLKYENFWWEREDRIWKQVVDDDIRGKTENLILKYPNQLNKRIE